MFSTLVLKRGSDEFLSQDPSEPLRLCVEFHLRSSLDDPDQKFAEKLQRKKSIERA